MINYAKNIELSYNELIAQHIKDMTKYSKYSTSFILLKHHLNTGIEISLPKFLYILYPVTSFVSISTQFLWTGVTVILFLFVCFLLLWIFFLKFTSGPVILPILSTLYSQNLWSERQWCFLTTYDFYSFLLISYLKFLNSVF